MLYRNTSFPVARKDKRQIHLQQFYRRQSVQLQVPHDHLQHCCTQQFGNRQKRSQKNQQIAVLEDDLSASLLPQICLQEKLVFPCQPSIGHAFCAYWKCADSFTVSISHCIGGYPNLPGSINIYFRMMNMLA